jgi:hypothetical protein
VDNHVPILKFGKSDGVTFLLLTLFMAAEAHLSEQLAFRKKMKFVFREAETLLQWMIAEEKRLAVFRFPEQFQRCFQQSDAPAMFFKKFSKISGMAI